MDIDSIRFLWDSDSVKYTEEVQDRLWEREVSRENIGQAISTGRIVEERAGKPYRKCRVQGWASRTVGGLEVGLQVLNVVLAVGETLYIITVYWEVRA